MKVPWKSRQSPRYLVIAMQAGDMIVAHPNTDYTHVCSKCGATLGVYPSTIKLMKERKNVILVCNRCQPDAGQGFPLVPGAIDEVRKSRRRN